MIDANVESALSHTLATAALKSFCNKTIEVIYQQKLFNKESTMENTRYNKSLEEKVLKYIDENCNEAFEELAELVKIDTQNSISHGNENEGQAYLAKMYKEIGMDVDIYAPDSVEGLVDCDEYNKGRGTDKRENLVAVFEGEENKNGIMLAAHMDTVPVGDLSLWERSPFSGLIENGHIHGRGAGDDKFGLAASWFVIKALKECGFKPKKNVLLGSYVDEEFGGGNGALGLCLKYPCECYVNLDSKGLERAALGGSCYDIKVKSTQNEKSLASFFDLFNGLNAIKEELEIWHNEPNITVRFSEFGGGNSGAKEGSLSFVLYTNKTEEETNKKLDEILKKISPKLDELKLASDGFIRTAKFFSYDKTEENSKEAAILAENIREITGIYPETEGSCLSDLSIFMRFGTKNSFNYGLPRGDEHGGGAHQPNEFIWCDDLKNCIKAIALLLLRM